MRKNNDLRFLGIILTCLLWVSASVINAQTRTGVVNYLNITTKVSCSVLGAQLESLSGVKITVAPEIADVQVESLVYNKPTPLISILEDIKKVAPEVDYSNSPSGNGYLLYSRVKNYNVNAQPTIDNAPMFKATAGGNNLIDFSTAISSPIIPISNLPSTNDTIVAGPVDTTEKVVSYENRNGEKLFQKFIELKFTSTSDITWMLGYKDAKAPDPISSKKLRDRITRYFSPSDNIYNYNQNMMQQPNNVYGGGNPLLAPSIPGNTSLGWGTGYGGNQHVAHQYGGYQPGYGGVQPGYGGYQPGYGGVQPGYGGVQPGYGGVQPGYGGVQPGAGGIPATGGAAGGTPWPNDPNSATAADLSGVLKGFLPKGITNVVGIPGTNSLLVQAKDEDSIKQLELLVRNLDQPIKQVTIQVQLVKMEAKEAVALGNSFSFAGVAFNLNTNNSFSGDTASSASYVNGNLRMAISALETEHRAYTVNAPSVVVQNNGTASFMMEDSVPFIYMNQTTDIYGQSYSTPTVYMQTFSQGLVVNSVTIHPDNTVTMRIEPIIEAPLGSVEIPGSSAVGGAASLMGYSRCTIDTTVTVKSGETIMMGGFTSRDDSQDDTRTPILSQLPIIGSLFFHGKNKTKSSTQVMLFVTPIIYKDDNTNLGSFAMQGTNFNM